MMLVNQSPIMILANAVKDNRVDAAKDAVRQVENIAMLSAIKTLVPEGTAVKVSNFITKQIHFLEFKKMLQEGGEIKPFIAMSFSKHTLTEYFNTRSFSQLKQWLDTGSPQTFPHYSILQSACKKQRKANFQKLSQGQQILALIRSEDSSLTFAKLKPLVDEMPSVKEKISLLSNLNINWTAQQSKVCGELSDYIWNSINELPIGNISFSLLSASSVAKYVALGGSLPEKIDCCIVRNFPLVAKKMFEKGSLIHSNSFPSLQHCLDGNLVARMCIFLSNFEMHEGTDEMVIKFLSDSPHLLTHRCQLLRAACFPNFEQISHESFSPEMQNRFKVIQGIASIAKGFPYKFQEIVVQVNAMRQHRAWFDRVEKFLIQIQKKN